MLTKGQLTYLLFTKVKTRLLFYCNYENVKKKEQVNVTFG